MRPNTKFQYVTSKIDHGVKPAKTVLEDEGFSIMNGESFGRIPPKILADYIRNSTCSDAESFTATTQSFRKGGIPFMQAE